MKYNARKINTITIGIHAAELLASSQDMSLNYERAVKFVFEQLQGFADRIRLYASGGNNGEIFQEETICTGAGIKSGSDIVPLYQLPKALTRERQVCWIHDSTAAYLLVPLVYSLKLLGFLEFRVVKAWDEDFVREIAMMANAFSLGLNHAVLMQENIRVKQYYESIARIVNHIQTISNINRLMSEFVRSVVGELKFDRATVFIYERDSRAVAYNCCSDSTGAVHQLHEIPELPTPGNRPEPLKHLSGYWFPLITSTSDIGVALFDNIYSSFSIPETLVEMMPTLCNQFAAAFENIRLFADVQNSAQHDGLTGLYNRAFFEEELQRLDTSRQLPLSIILGDVNGLKITNDVFGHYEGDKILRAAGEVMSKACRSDDIVARWGGDEFIILLPRTSEKTVENICKRINKACLGRNDTIIQLSISLGCATRLSTDEDIRMTVKSAEDRMYHHKLFESRSFRRSFIASLRDTLAERCQESAEHVGRMEKLAVLIGTAADLTDTELDELKLLALLHDIGKVAINNDVINKPGKLENAEWEEVKTHSEIGYRIALSSPDVSRVADYILYHHERWDGTGYPLGRKSYEIPKLSRIIAVIDAYDIMTNGRSYKAAISHNEAVDELVRCSGKQFDPYFVEIFIKLFGKH